MPDKVEQGNGNGSGKKLEQMNKGQALVVDEEMRKALLQNDSMQEVNEPTKYILLDNALVESVNDERVKHFTKYKNVDEVLQMNDIEAHARLLPLVFKSKHVSINQEITKIAKLFYIHAHDHMDNMMSLDDKSGNTAKLLVLALKADNNPYPDGKQMKRLFS